MLTTDEFKWALFNLFTQRMVYPGLYFSGRVYVVARMLQTMDLAMKDWQTMSHAEKGHAQQQAWAQGFEGGAAPKIEV